MRATLRTRTDLALENLALRHHGLGTHRQGFRAFWTWKSRRKRTGRPPVASELADLVRTMALANPLWGAPRIHGELLKLGLDVSQRTVARLMPRRPKPPSQTWRTFLQNHVADLVSVDFFMAKDAPEPRAVEPPGHGHVVALPHVGGLHHRYVRRAA